MIKTTLALSVLAFASLARADILFLDLNDAKMEIDAARKAAAARGEQLIVIPKETDRTQASAASLKREIARLNVPLSSVIISGHDGNGRFSGSREGRSIDMTVEEMRDAISSNPNAMKDVRSVLLWGCRTTNIGSIDTHWKGIFPNVGVFAGFDGRGPSKIRDANHRYLEDFLRVDRELIQARDKNTMEKLVNGIGGFNVTASSICTDKFMVTPTGPGSKAAARDIGAIRRDCSPQLPEMKKGLEVFNCYRNARGTLRLGNRTLNCANPPANAVNQDPACNTGEVAAYESESCNPLGVFHQVLSSKMQCRAYWEEIRDDVVVPEPHSIQMLLNFDNFKANLGRLHREELTKIDQMLADVGAPANLRVGNLAQLSRAEIIKRLGDLQVFLGGPNTPDIDSPKAVQMDQLREATTELSQVISGLEKAPPEWYEPNSSAPAPSLKNVLTPARAGEIKVDHQIIRLDRGIQAQRQDLQRSHRLAAEIAKVDQRFAATGDRSERMALISKRTDLVNERDKDIATQLRAQVQTQIRGMRFGTAYEEAAYKRYLENIARR